MNCRASFLEKECSSNIICRDAYLVPVLPYVVYNRLRTYRYGDIVTSPPETTKVRAAGFNITCHMCIHFSMPQLQHRCPDSKCELGRAYLWKTQTRAVMTMMAKMATATTTPTTSPTSVPPSSSSSAKQTSLRLHAREHVMFRHNWKELLHCRTHKHAGLRIEYDTFCCGGRRRGASDCSSCCRYGHSRRRRGDDC